MLVVILFVTSSVTAQENRNLDGFGNHTTHQELGTAGSTLRTLTTVDFADGIGSPSGIERANPRVISNKLFSQDGAISDSKSLSDYNWVFGQFIDHDIS